MAEARSLSARYQENIKVHKRFVALLLLTTLGIALQLPAYADIFRCVDNKGEMLFTNLACPSGTRSSIVVNSADVCSGQGCAGGPEYSSTYEQSGADSDPEPRHTEQPLTALPQLQVPTHAPAYEPPMLERATPYGASGEATYPGYSIIGVPIPCGRHCFQSNHHRHDHDHHRHEREPDTDDPRHGNAKHGGGEEHRGRWV